MTLARWLDERRPLPPPVLRARIDAALAGELEREADDLAETCLVAAEGLVRSLLGDGASTRGSALDLLAADALVTYAFEAASERPHELADRAAAAMRRIAALAHSPAAGTPA